LAFLCIYPLEILEKKLNKMIRPVIYRIIPRLIIGLVLVLLWDRFLNVPKVFSMTANAFFVLGIIFFAMAWFTYLKKDGVKFHFLNENKTRTLKKRRGLKFMMTDFSDDEPSPDDVLDDRDIINAELVANIITGFCFLLISVFSMVLFR